MRTLLIVLFITCFYWLFWFGNVQLGRVTSRYRTGRRALSWEEETCLSAEELAEPNPVLRLGAWFTHAPVLWPARSFAVWCAAMGVLVGVWNVVPA